MKKLLSIIVLGLLLSGNAISADNLKGKNLYCANDYYHMSFEFINISKVKWIEVNPGKLDNGFKENISKYKTTLKHIIIDADERTIHINRRSLKLDYLKCEIFELKKNRTLKMMMKELFDMYERNARSKNKI